jgi:hypothetical protein
METTRTRNDEGRNQNDEWRLRRSRRVLSLSEGPDVFDNGKDIRAIAALRTRRDKRVSLHSVIRH